MKSVSLKILFMLFVCFLVVSYGYAQTNDTLNTALDYKPDDKTEGYSKSQLFSGFFDTAFTSHINAPVGRNDSYFFPCSEYLPLNRNTFFKPERILIEYPWLYEFLFRTEGVPRFFALNKWYQPMKVSIGYPNDLDPLQKYEYKGKYYYLAQQKTDARPSHIRYLKEEISKLYPVIKNVTNFEISFLPREEETSDTFGNIRLIFVKNVENWKTKYKKGEMLRLLGTSQWPKPMFFRSHIEPQLHTAVKFTPSSQTQVDGFLLADRENRIQLALCYIWAGHPPDIIKGLIRECLFRSLGLPGATDQSPIALLSYRDNSKANAIPEVTVYDKAILETLYDQDFNSGMSIYDIQRILLNDN